MERNFFILAIDESKGYPSGSYDAVLTRAPHPIKEGPIKLGDYGHHQWYAWPDNFWDELDPLPDDIVLFEKGRPKHNVRMDGGGANLYNIRFISKGNRRSQS